MPPYSRRGLRTLYAFGSTAPAGDSVQQFLPPLLARGSAYPSRATFPLHQPRIFRLRGVFRRALTPGPTFRVRQGHSRSAAGGGGLDGVGAVGGGGAVPRVPAFRGFGGLRRWGLWVAESACCRCFTSRPATRGFGGFRRSVLLLRATCCGCGFRFVSRHLRLWGPRKWCACGCVCGFASRHSRSWGPQRCRSPADGHSSVAMAGVACLHARDMHSSGTKRLRDCRVRFTPGVARLHSRALRSGCLLGRASHPAESAGGLILFPRVARLSGQGGGLCIPGNWWPSPGA